MRNATLTITRNCFAGLLVVASVLFAESSQAHITYMVAGPDFGVTFLNKSWHGDTSHTQARATVLCAMHRPNRIFAFGISYNFPVDQGSSFSFAGSSVTGGSFNYFEDPFLPNEQTLRSFPDVFTYEFNQGGSLNLEGRLIQPELGVYGELGWSFFNFEELFVLRRQSHTQSNNSSGSISEGPVDAHNIYYQKNHQISSHLLGFGWMKEFQSRIYVDFSIRFKIMRFPDETFSHDILKG